MEWPGWWDWDLELSPHLLKRMEDRRFTEVELRHMIDRATGCRPDAVPGRWVIETRHRRSEWRVVVEPEERLRAVVVITASPVEGMER